MADTGKAAQQELRRIKLGHSNLEITRMGFGCMGMSEFYGPSDDENSIRTLQAALDNGINFFDTADMYGSGHNEELLAKAFGDRWDRLVLATKFAVVRGPNGEWLGISNKPEYIRTACEASLRRLGRDSIDLYYMHRRDKDVPLSESIGAMSELVLAGKVRYIGISEVTPDELREANAIHPISAVQNELSMWSRDPLNGMLEATQESGATFVSYSPLGRGFLTGAIQDREDLSDSDFRLRNPRFSEAALAQNQAFLEVIERIATLLSATPAQIALAWVLNQAENVAVIPGTRQIERLRENIGADALEFTRGLLAEIAHQLPDETAGTRY